MTNKAAFDFMRKMAGDSFSNSYEHEVYEFVTDMLKRQKVGTWKPHGKSIGGRFTLWKCSVCGCVIFSEDEQDRTTFHKYCGMCGAKMEDET